MRNNNQSMTLHQNYMAQQEYLKSLEEGFNFADVFINRPYLDHFNKAEILIPKHSYLFRPQDVRVFRVTKVVFDKEEDVSDKLISVYNALYNLSVTVGLFIKGSVYSVEFYFATRAEEAALAGDILEASLLGNFPGIDLKKLDGQAVRAFQESLSGSSNGCTLLNGLATVSMVPSLRDKDKKDQFVQGLEKFIHALRGKNYTAAFLAVPLGKEDISTRRHGYEELYSTLSPHAKLSYAYGENLSNAVNKGVSFSFTKSLNESVSNSNSTSSSSTHGYSSGYSSGDSFNWGGWGSNSSSSSSSSSSYTSGTSFSHSISNSVGTAEAQGEQRGETQTVGTSKTRTLNYENKGVSNLMKKIEEQLNRLNVSEAYGLWECCAYFFSNDIATSMLAATTYKSLMTGENTNVENAHVNSWNAAKSQGAQIQQIMDHVQNLVHPSAPLSLYNEYSKLFVTPTSLVNGNELAILLGMPRKSVSGLVVQEMAEFGRDVFYENKLPTVPISIGNIYHMGIEEKSRPVEMDLNLFSSHCFITGSSGSGKSYATYNLLDRLISQGIKILVIEPAKGEYKMVFGKLDRVNIFTTELNSYRLLKINPFQFPEEIHVLSHIEQLMQIFNASWALYSAMPAILKEAVVYAYVKCGWDLKNSVWIKGISEKKYPVFEDVLEILPRIIKTSEYSSEVQGNFTGALVTRVKEMTTGLNGLIFKGSNSVEAEKLFDENTIIDLSEVGSEETIALIMGFLIMQLGEYRKSRRKAGFTSSHDNALSHVTVLEEAHNLLKRTSKEQNQEGSNMVGKSVEMISNSIKEMRTYGEGFLIIDQSPLAVDSSVIENTSTKIIMNTPSKDACEELGSALSLNEEQTKELSRLNVGVAAVMQKGWLSPVLMRVGLWNAQKYEADLIVENRKLIMLVRSRLTEELFRQIRVQKFSTAPLDEIIRTSSLSTDRRAELEEITTLYHSLKKSQGMTEETLGRLFLEIINCESLFDIIPQDGLCTLNKYFAIMEKKNREEQAKFRKGLRNAIKDWVGRTERALNQYISVEYIVKRCALNYMIALKGKSGSDENIVFGLIYAYVFEDTLNEIFSRKEN